jgi:hypothetical protein
MLDRSGGERTPPLPPLTLKDGGRAGREAPSPLGVSIVSLSPRHSQP